MSSTVSYTFSKHGSPQEVLKPVLGEALGSPKDNQISVTFLAAGISSVDLETIQGQGGAAAADSVKGPTVAGHEGVAVVTAVGSGVKDIQPGDHVIPIKMNVGTWRTQGIVQASDVAVVPKSVKIEYAGTMSVAGLCAYQLIKQSGVKEGDVIIQNGAEDPIGQAVVQLANAMQISTICIVPDNPLQQARWSVMLQLMGAEVVVPESYLSSEGIKLVLNDFKPPKAFFNKSSSSSGAAIAKLLSKGTPTICFGAGSSDHEKGLSDLKLSHVSIGSLMDSIPKSEVPSVVSYLANLAEQGKLNFWLQRVSMTDMSAALKDSMSPTLDRKVVLVTKEGEKLVSK